MKKIAKIEIEKSVYKIDLNQSYDLSIPIDPNKKSPSFYDKEPLKIKYYNDSKKIWEIKKGSTCNIPVINLNIHCGSTHTECRSHITKESLNISEIIKDSFIPTILKQLKERKNVHLMDEKTSPLSSISFHYSDGHTVGLMMSEIETAQGLVCFISDLSPILISL